ncbi:hypothetical protein GW17_00037823 [Ensete ventricosum]|nr:hypothetical protein GW17_00037823 [Ensete ventricosum]
MLGWSRVGGSRIKQLPHVGLPRTTARSRIKWRPHAEKATQAATSRASGSNHMPAAGGTQPHRPHPRTGGRTGRNRVLAAA